MERRKTVAAPSPTPLAPAKSETTLNVRKSVTGVSSSTPDCPSPEVPTTAKARMSQSLEPDNQLVITQRLPRKASNKNLRPELAQGFSLFQSLYPFRNGPRRVISPSDSFHEENHLHVGPKGTLSDVVSPSARLSIRKLPEMPENVNIKTIANGEKRRNGKPRKSTLNVFSWLEEEDTEILRGTIVGKLPSPGRETMAKSIVRTQKPPVFPGTLPSILGRATMKLRDLPEC